MYKLIKQELEWFGTKSLFSPGMLTSKIKEENTVVFYYKKFQKHSKIERI